MVGTENLLLMISVTRDEFLFGSASRFKGFSVWVCAVVTVDVRIA